MDFLIDAEWSPQGAFAVSELLSDLRTRIGVRNGIGLLELVRQQRSLPNVSDIGEVADPF
jgi:hypothetical protein